MDDIELSDGGCTATINPSAPLDVDAANALIAQLRTAGVEQIDSQSTLVRYAARQAGFSGALRAPLHWSGSSPGNLVVDIEALVPDVAVALAPHRRLLGFVADSTSGVSGMTRLRVTPRDRRKPLTIALPARDDLSAEALAGVIDVMLSIHARYGRLAESVREVSFDHAVNGMAQGKVGGAAPHIRGAIHLNADYAYADGMVALSEAIQRRLSEDRRRVVARGLPAPWFALDGVVAHEMWHKIEMDWEARRYADTIEFRRAIGSWFGLDTLEHVFTNEATRYTLATEVSLYATTNRSEATAEMFKQFWCGPPAPGSIPARFGELLVQYFPPA